MPLARRSFAAVALLLVGCGSSVRSVSSVPASSVQATAEKASLRRGMNLGNALDAPNEGDWGVVLKASDFAAVRKAGFDHVRLPARFSAHAGMAPPYAIEGSFLARVDWAIDQALSNGLAVIVDLHHYGEMMEAPDEHRPRFVALWKQIAERERSRPEAVVFELCNEPNGKMTADKWNATMADALRVVRSSNPTRPVVVEGVEWASAKSLRDTLAIPADDANLVGSFHMYQPILFTHQGADWMPPEYATRGIVFPGPPVEPLSPAPSANAVPWVRGWFKRYNEEPRQRNPSGAATVMDQLDLAQGFAERTHRPVYMGEFGAIDHADAKSRAAWTRMTRREAERRDFGWAYWDDGGSFMAYDRRDGSWIPFLKSALLD